MSIESNLFWIAVMVTFVIYWMLPNRKSANFLLLLVSYFFYASWDPRFVVILMISSVTDFFAAQIARPTQSKTLRRLGLGLSLGVNIGLLVLFKYASDLGVLPLLPGVISEMGLPIGISFYTFQTISYTLDVYRGHIKPTQSFLEFCLYVAFFPQLAAGPIEKAKNLLPQFLSTKSLQWNRVFSGCYLIILGLFKKMFVAEGLHYPTELIYAGDYYSGGYFLLAGLLMTLRVYADFSAYSDIARGIARCFDINLKRNFRPFYFAKNPIEFWSRWHLSLTHWIRDYIIIPLRKKTKSKTHFYLLSIATMVLVGVWHGATFNWVLFGFFHGVLIVGTKLTQNYWRTKSLPTFLSLCCSGIIMISIYIISGMLHLTKSKSHLIDVIIPSIMSDLNFHRGLFDLFIYSLFFIIPLVIVDWLREKYTDEFNLEKDPRWARWCILTISLAGILIFERASQSKFIYYDF
jgi:alginate O-acetyltransferase complex protein AlgI